MYSQFLYPQKKFIFNFFFCHRYCCCQQLIAFVTSIANSKHLVIIIILREFKAVTLLITIIYFVKRLNNDSDRSSVLHEHGFSMCVRKAVHIENHHHYRHHHHDFLMLLLLSPSSSLSASTSPYCLSELMGPKCT